MNVPALPFARLAALTELLGDADVDIAATLTMLADRVRLAVPSFLGLSVLVTGAGSGLQVDVMEQVFVGRIQSSLLIPTSEALARVSRGERPTARPSIALVLYAARPGARVDLAADLAWLTSLPWPVSSWTTTWADLGLDPRRKQSRMEEEGPEPPWERYAGAAGLSGSPGSLARREPGEPVYSAGAGNLSTSGMGPAVRCRTRGAVAPSRTRR
ncbi:hypothetical protein [Lapillicoccus sp.]|uniref:hypothetical protein n=1 Tax=Lapillicoccus sp. TaxID=1909287 RepID=UPI0039839B7A